MKRVLVAAIHHESNSFNPIIAGDKDFTVRRGEEIIESVRPNDSLSGIITTLKAAGYDIVPAVSARAVPNGLVDPAFYLRIKNEIIHKAIQADQVRKLDAITLSLHGSMRVKDIGEAEGPLLRELRLLFPDIPIFSSLDMHTTMTHEMQNNCDGFVGYKCAPHTDCTETGEHAAKMTIKVLEENIEPKSAWIRVPILVAGEQSATAVEPMLSLIDKLREVEERKGIMAASYLMGFPWADNPDSSVGVHVVAENSQELANQAAMELAEIIWSKRYEFTFETEAYHQEMALDKAYEAVESGLIPTYISDSGDNPTAGAASDNTKFLQFIIKDARAKKLNRKVLYAGFYDPEATRACEGKIGQEIELTFGSKFDSKTSDPIKATGIVKAYYKDWTRFNFPKGDLALFDVNGVEIVLAEQHVGYTDPQMFRDLGLEPENIDIIICKLGYLTPGHQVLARKAILALTDGNTNEDLTRINYQQVKRPIFPLDKDFTFENKVECIK